ncbi:MAG: amino acid permease, partial [Weissella soli]
NMFTIVYSSSVLPGMVPWFVILWSELSFRRSNKELLKDHPFKMPLYPFTNYFAMITLVIILGFMFVNPDTRVSVSVGAVFLLIMTALYFVQARKNKIID